jgi:hypothetical protein
LVKGGKDLPTTTTAMVRGPEEPRYYSTVPYIYQPHLATVQFAAFFSLCRLRGVSFDVRARVGTVFSLMDSLAAGSLGIMSIGLAAPPPNSSAAIGGAAASAAALASLPPSPLHSMSLLVDALAFLQEQASSLRFGAHLYDSESNLALVLNAYKGLLRAQKEANQMMLLEQQIVDMHAH